MSPKTSIHRTAFVALLLLANYALSQETTPPPDIVTDRPDVTESSVVVPKGSLQFENGITWAADHGDQPVDFTETLVRIGISTRTELRVVLPNYSTDIWGSSVAIGSSDMAIGAKQQIGPLWRGFDLAVIAAVSLPTGTARLSSHGFDPFIKFPWSKDLAKGWSIGGMQSFFWNTQNGRRNVTWEPTFVTEKEITKPLSAFVEYAGDFAQRGGSKQIAHFGLAYKVTSDQQIDCHFGFGLSPAAPNRFFAFGYSIRLDSLL